ncbi:hypothetical protein D083_2601 [Dickeya solani RNS 08.23.3.1.A]|nr:hypothetical protein D083_2601 [Dickeya solani RNS 08.23.3.1.A]
MLFISLRQYQGRYQVSGRSTLFGAAATIMVSVVQQGFLVG